MDCDSNHNALVKEIRLKLLWLGPIRQTKNWWSLEHYDNYKVKI